MRVVDFAMKFFHQNLICMGNSFGHNIILIIYLYHVNILCIIIYTYLCIQMFGIIWDVS